MQLKDESKISLRKKVEEQLKKVPEGQKIHIDKTLLEELLFDVAVPQKESQYQINAKIPIWSGEFLRKIDLSEVSFENVAWSVLNYVDGPNFAMIWDWASDDYQLKIETEGKCHWKYEVLEHGKKIDYSYTNANIDFNNSWEAKLFGKSEFYQCDFSGLDFSNKSLDNVKSIMDCNFSNTGIKLSSDELYHKFNSQEYPEPAYVKIYRTSFSENDLSSIEVNVDRDYLIRKIDLSGTGTHININLTDSPESYLSFEYGSEKPTDMVEEHIRAGFWDGCFLNGKLFYSDEDKKGMYTKYEQSIFSSLDSSIEEQINHMKK